MVHYGHISGKLKKVHGSVFSYKDFKQKKINRWKNHLNFYAVNMTQDGHFWRKMV